MNRINGTVAIRHKQLRLFLLLLFLCLAAAVGYYLFFMRLVLVPSGSMSNTIIPGDHLIVRRVFGEIGRGDIIIFKYPKDPSTQRVSRVIGLPRESIEFRDRRVYINGKELSEQRVTVRVEDYSSHEALEEVASEGAGPYRVFYVQRDEVDVSGVLPDAEEEQFGVGRSFQIPDNQYFVMGDNRDNSEDSRFWGTVPRDFLLYKASLIYWSAVADRSGGETIRWERVFRRVK